MMHYRLEGSSLGEPVMRRLTNIDLSARVMLTVIAACPVGVCTGMDCHNLTTDETYIVTAIILLRAGR